VSATEVASGSFFEGASFLVTDDHHFAASEFREPGKHRTIITEKFIAMEFDEFIECEVQVIAGVGAIFVS
jgi:hypothetical protein